MRSRPARARGLKLVVELDCEIDGMSRPARARGLKLPDEDTVIFKTRVAPRAGAWIETISGSSLRPGRARGLKLSNGKLMSIPLRVD